MASTQRYPRSKVLVRVLAAMIAAWMLFGIYAMSVRNSYEAELYGAALTGTLTAIGLSRLVYRKTVTWRSRTVAGIIGGAFAFHLYSKTGGLPDFRDPYGNSAAPYGRALGAAVYWVVWIHACLITVRGPAVRRTRVNEPAAMRRHLLAARSRMRVWHGGKLVLLWFMSGLLFLLLKELIDSHGGELPLVLFYWCLLTAPLFWASWVWLDARQVGS
jgi:hypothetical protein